MLVAVIRSVPRVPLLEVVGVRGRLVRGHPDIEDRGLLGGRHRLHERSVELPAAGNIEVGDDAAPRVLAVGVVDVRTHFGSLLIGWMLKVGRCERARGRGRSGHDAGVIQRLVAPLQAKFSRHVRSSSRHSYIPPPQVGSLAARGAARMVGPPRPRDGLRRRRMGSPGGNGPVHPCGPHRCPERPKAACPTPDQPDVDEDAS